MSCTGIVESCRVLDSAADGKHGWIKLEKALVTLDSGIHTTSQYALNIDFVGGSQDVKTTVELSPTSARELLRTIQAALSKGVKMGIIDEG
jgi:methionine aminopeptidase